MRASDTSPEAAAVLLARTRAMTPAQRLEEGLRLCASARGVMRAGIRLRRPDYDDAQLEMAMARLSWGDDLYRRARPHWPMVEP